MPDPSDARLDPTAEEATPSASRSGDTQHGSTGSPGTIEELPFLSPSQAPDELGRLGHYRVLKKLGRGGMGQVLLAEDTQLLRRVALKVMLPIFAADASAKDRFLREARAAAAVHHDHVVTIYQVGEENDVPFIAMQHLHGLPLDVYLRKVGDPGLPHALRIGREIAEGLAAAHAQGLIHRDIKPANIWLEAPAGRVKLLDFGLARQANTNVDLTGPGAPVGTPAYMSPEQARGERVDARADLFSLGCVLYRLCSGHPPFRGKTLTAVLTSLAVDNPPPVRKLNPAVPPALGTLIGRLLAKDPAARPQTAREVVQALRDIERPTTGPAVIYVPLAVPAEEESPWSGIDATAPFDPTPPPALKRKPIRTGPVLLVLSGLVALTTVGFIIVRSMGDRPDPAPPKQVDQGTQTQALESSPDRRAAAWIAQIGGKAELRKENQTIALRPGTALPTGPFEITSIDLAGLGQVNDAALANLRGLKQLGALDLSGTVVTALGLAVLRELPQLKSLTIHSPRLTDGGLKQLRGLKLEKLFFSSKAVTDAGLTYLEGMPLTHLNAAGQFTDDGLRKLAGFDNLLFLGVGSDALSDVGLQALPTYRDLVALSLYGAGLTDVAVARCACRQPKLEVLQLNYFALTEAGLKELAGARGLKRLELGAPKEVPEVGLQALHKELPECAIVIDGKLWMAPR
jgi:eukaryotic-like serine/threonine-protein kinase